MNSQPEIACDLSAIEENGRETHREKGQALFDAISLIRETPNGYSFRLPADTDCIEHAGAFIAKERLCCPFFEFTLTIPANRNPVWLKLGGREGVKSYIEETLLPRLDVPVVS